MTPSEIDELERLMTAATPGPWTFTLDDDSKAATRGWREVHAGRTRIVAADWYERRSGGETETVSGVRLGEPNAAAIVALHNHAPALIEVAREVERLRAFVPRWERQQAFCYRLLCGKTVLAAIEVYDDDSAAWWKGDWFTGITMRAPSLSEAARAVCARLGIPYVPVEVDDG